MLGARPGAAGGRPAAPGCVGAARAPWLLVLSWWVVWLRGVWGERGVPLGAPEPGVQLRRGDGALLTVTFSSRFEYLFNFDNTFEIHDDIEVLKRMGMACGLESGSCSADDLKVARSLVPKALEPYVTGPLRPGRNARPSAGVGSRPVPRAEANGAWDGGGLWGAGAAAVGHHLAGPWPLGTRGAGGGDKAEPWGSCGAGVTSGPHLPGRAPGL